MSHFGAVHRRTSAPSAAFDTRFGTATDTSIGWITFGLKSGCRMVYVNNSPTATGNDANDGLTPATAVQTVDKGCQIRNVGYTAGDHLMFAEGGTYTDTGGIHPVFPFSGYSLTYPTAALSYDPADPTNAAKYGRAVGAKRPRIQHAYDGGATGASSFSPLTTDTNYLAIQGLEIVGQFQTSVAPDGFTSGVSFTNRHVGIAIQNTLWNQCNLSFDMAEYVSSDGSNPASADHSSWGGTILVSKSAGYGQWRVNGNSNWMFFDGVDGVVLEDLAGVHTGWKMGASRDDALSAGGASHFGHGIYLGGWATNVTTRRIIGIDPPQDMFSFRGNFAASALVSIDAGQVMTFGGYSTFYNEVPNGSIGTLTDMTVLGGSLISTTDGGGGGFGARNVITGSYADNIALIDNPEKGVASGGDILWAAGNDNPNITVTVAVSNMRAYNWATTFEGANGGSHPISLNYTNCQTDTIAPRGTGNSTWSGAPAGYQTRDQIVTSILTQMGVTPGASYTARKAQLVNYLLEYPDLAGQITMAIDTLGLQSLGLSPKTHPVTTAPSVSGLTAPRSVY